MNHRGFRILTVFPMNEETAKRLAVAMAVLCVRNTSIEDIHAGIEPYSPSGDFSDVKVVHEAGRRSALYGLVAIG